MLKFKVLRGGELCSEHRSKALALQAVVVMSRGRLTEADFAIEPIRAAER